MLETPPAATPAAHLSRERRSIIYEDEHEFARQMRRWRGGKQRNEGRPPPPEGLMRASIAARRCGGCAKRTLRAVPSSFFRSQTGSGSPSEDFLFCTTCEETGNADGIEDKIPQTLPRENVRLRGLGGTSGEMATFFFPVVLRADIFPMPVPAKYRLDLILVWESR